MLYQVANSGRVLYTATKYKKAKQFLTELIIREHKIEIDKCNWGLHEGFVSFSYWEDEPGFLYLILFHKD